MPRTTEHGFFPLATYTLPKKWSFNSPAYPQTLSWLLLITFSKRCHPPNRRETWGRDHLGSSVNLQTRRDENLGGEQELYHTVYWTTPAPFTAKNTINTRNNGYTNSMGKCKTTTRNSPACWTVSHPGPIQPKGWKDSHSLCPISCFPYSGCKKHLGEKILKLSKTSYMVISINSKHIGKGGFSCCYNWFLLTWKVYAVCKNQVTKIYLKYFHFQIIQNFKNRNLFNSIPLCGSITQNFVCVSAPPKPSKPPMESGNYA